MNIKYIEAHGVWVTFSPSLLKLCQQHFHSGGCQPSLPPRCAYEAYLAQEEGKTILIAHSSNFHQILAALRGMVLVAIFGACVGMMATLLNLGQTYGVPALACLVVGSSLVIHDDLCRRVMHLLGEMLCWIQVTHSFVNFFDLYSAEARLGKCSSKLEGILCYPDKIWRCILTYSVDTCLYMHTHIYLICIGHSIWHLFWHSFWHIFRHWVSHSFWHIFWHSIWHSVWHLFWPIFWHSIWHLFRHYFWHFLWHFLWHSFCLAPILAFYLASLVVFSPAYLDMFCHSRWHPVLLLHYISHSFCQLY